MRLLRLAEEDIAGIKKGKALQVAAQIGMAIDQLERGIRGAVEAAQRDLGVEIITALGPYTTAGQVQGARQMLSLLLDALPDLPGDSP